MPYDFCTIKREIIPMFYIAYAKLKTLKDSPLLDLLWFSLPCFCWLMLYIFPWGLLSLSPLFPTHPYIHAHNQLLSKVWQWQERKSKHSQFQEHFVLVKTTIPMGPRGVRYTTAVGLFIGINTLILQTRNRLFVKWTLEHWKQGLLNLLPLLKHNHSRILNFNEMSDNLICCR